MATLTVQSISLAGLVHTLQAADVAGDKWDNSSGRVFFLINNADAGPHTVTFDSIDLCDQGFDHNQAVIVAAGARTMIGPFSPGRFNAAGTNLVSATYDAVTAVTVAAIRLP